MPLTRTERLDRLPFTRKHTRLLVGSGAGWAFDAMDVGLISFVIAALAVEWDVAPGQLSWVASAGFLGMAVGASLGGLLADRIGRRQVFALTLLVYGLATGASALSWSVGALIVLRFVVGLGLGAELPVASTLVSEFAPPRIRGRVVVALEAFWAVGLDAVGPHRVPRGARGERVAVGPGDRRAAGALRRLRPAGAARVGPLPRGARSARGGRGGRRAVRGVRRGGHAGRTGRIGRTGRTGRTDRTGRRRHRSGRDHGPRWQHRRRRRDAHRGAARRSPARRRALLDAAARAHRDPVGRVVRGELLLLRRLHLAADAARRLRVLARPVVRVHAHHHARPAARGTRCPRCWSRSGAGVPPW